MKFFSRLWTTIKEYFYPSVQTRILKIQDAINEALSNLRSSDLVYITRNELVDKAPSTSCGELSFKWLVIGVLNSLKDKYKFTYESEYPIGFPKTLFEDVHLFFDSKTEVILELKYIPLRFTGDYNLTGNDYSIVRKQYPLCAADWLGRNTDIETTYFNAYGLGKISALEYLDNVAGECNKYRELESPNTPLWCLVGVGNRCFGKIY